jgi:hypothetical protein
VDGLAVYGAFVGTAALGWQAWSWRATQQRHAAESERARESQTIANLQAALDDVAVAIGRAHSGRFKPIRGQRGEPIREIWDPHATLDPETDEQLAEAGARVVRFREQVRSDELREAADRVMTLSAAVCNAASVEVARDEREQLGAALREAHKVAATVTRRRR